MSTSAAYPQFTREAGVQKIHFLHVRSEREDGPLMLNDRIAVSLAGLTGPPRLASMQRLTGTRA
jgi:hypothetical protein